MLFLLNVDERVEAVLNNDIPNGCPYWNDKHTERLEDALSTYEFEMPADHEAAEAAIAENYVARADLDGNMILFTIKNVEEYSQDGQYIKKVYAENAAVAELNGDIIRPKTLTGVSAPQAIDHVLNGTKWVRGRVDYLGSESVPFTDYETALKGLHIVSGRFGGELRYRITLSNNRISKRYVDLLERRGSETGKRFEYAKDIAGLRRVEDSSELATALILLGKVGSDGKRMTIHTVNNNIDYISDNAARDRWSRSEKHIFGVYIDEDAQNPTDLKARGQKELSRRKNPRFTYETDVVLLERKTGIAHEDVRLGDGIKLKDESFVPYLALGGRVIELVRSYTDPTQDKATLGEFVKLFISTPSLISSMQKQIAATIGQVEATSVHKGTTPPDNLEQLWLDMSNENLYVWKKWNGAEWVPATPTSAAEIGAETPSGAQAKANAALAAAEAKAQEKADAAKAAAIAAAQAEDALAEARANAYADGKVTAEEQRAIARAEADLAEAKADASTKANAARSEAYAYAQTVGVDAQAKAEWYAAVKNGANLIKKFDTSYTLPNGYTWATAITPDGTKGTVLKKEHKPNDPSNNGGIYLPAIKIDPKKTYLLEFYVKAADKNSRYYLGHEEFNAAGAQNDQGNGPYIVSARTATDADVNQWRKHFALIAPHDAGAENSHTTDQSTLTPDTDYKFYNASTASVQVKTFLTYQVSDLTKASIMYATKFGLYEVGSDDGLFNAIQEEAIAKANLAETQARAYADGKVSAEEARAIADAQAKANAAEAAAKTYAEGQAATALASAKTFATGEANAAKAAAISAANAETALAEARAKAYADGILTPEEQANIAALEQKFADANRYAEQKAAAAQQAAIDAAKLDAQSKADAAKASAISTANAETALAEARAKAYADGVVDAEEQARINALTANLDAAKADATSKANAAEAAAKAAAALDAQAKANTAEANAKNASEKKIVRSSTAPADTTVLWLKTGVTPELTHRHNGTTWVPLAPTTAAHVGAETPTGAQTKADAAKTAAISAAAADAQTKANAAKDAAIAAANAETALAEARAKAYADGILTDEEKQQIAALEQSFADAATDAQNKANAAKDAAIQAAAIDASTKAGNAESNAKNASEKKIARQASAPTDTSVIWLKTGTTPEIQYRHNGTSWVPMAPENASQLKYVSGATLESLKPAAAGADVTSQNTAADTAKVNGVASSTVTTAVTNFNNRNDRKSTTPATPTAPTLTHVVNTDGSVDLTFSWTFTGTGDAYDIDGFIVSEYAATTNAAYTVTGSGAAENNYVTDDLTRSIIIRGIAANKFYTIGVRAYRAVDTDVNSTGVIRGANVQNATPYQPSTTVTFGGTVSGTVTGNVTGQIAGVSATTVKDNAASGAAAAVNFNLRNDRKSTTPANPTIKTDGTAFDHVTNTNGSVDISFEWVFTGTGDAYDIDGFFVYVYASTSSGAYTFGTNAPYEQVFTTAADNRSIVMQGVSPDKYYTFGVQAYRRVDKDINAASILKSAIIKSTATGENPYRPSTTVAFAGNITGTLNGTGVNTVVTNANAGKTASDKITAEVGTGTLETTGGSQGKANQAKTDAIDFAKPAIAALSDPYFDNGLKLLTVSTFTGKEQASAEGEAGMRVLAGAGSTGGNTIEITGTKWVFTKNAIAIDTSRSYRVTFRVRQKTNPTTAGTSGVYAGVATLDSNFASITGGAGSHRYAAVGGTQITSSGGWYTFTGVITGVGDGHDQFRAGTAYVRPMFLVNYNGGNGVVEIDMFEFKDISDEINARDEVAKGLGSHRQIDGPSLRATSVAHTGSDTHGYGIFFETTEAVNIGDVTMKAVADVAGGTVEGTLVLVDQTGTTAENILYKSITLADGTNIIDLNINVPKAGKYWLGTLGEGWTGGKVHRADSTVSKFPYNGGSFTLTNGGQPFSTNAYYKNGFMYYFYDICVSGANVVGGVPKQITVTFDRARGGTVLLGGQADTNGTLELLNSSGEVIIDLNTERAGFKSITADIIQSPTIVSAMLPEDIETGVNIYVDPIGGNDDNTGRAPKGASDPWLYASQTIQNAIDQLPKYLDGQIRVFIHAINGKNIYEDVVVRGFHGAGTLWIDFQNSTNRLFGKLSIVGCTCRVTVDYGQISAVDAGVEACILVQNSSNVYIVNTKLFGNSKAIYGLYNYTSYTRISSAEINSCTTAAVISAYGAQADVYNVTGSNNKYSLYTYYTGTISGAGACPKYNTTWKYSEHGNTAYFINGDWSDPNPTTTTITPPPPAPTVYTKTWSSTDAESYRSTVYTGWQSDDMAVQGSYGYGLNWGYWFFGSTPSTTVTNKNITKIRVYLTRLSSGGSSGSTTVYIRPHTYTAKPSGAPASPSSTYVSTTFKWGEGKWVTLPSSFFAAFKSGSSKGLMIYTSSSSSAYYAKFSKSAKIEITYS